MTTATWPAAPASRGLLLKGIRSRKPFFNCVDVIRIIAAYPASKDQGGIVDHPDIGIADVPMFGQV